jgi:hypothetical protein
VGDVLRVSQSPVVLLAARASWILHAALFAAFACYLTVSAIVPIITDEPLPLAFLAA